MESGYFYLKAMGKAMSVLLVKWSVLMPIILKPTTRQAKPE